MKYRVLLAIVFSLVNAQRGFADDKPIDIGSRLELLVDDYLIERLEGRAALRLSRPTPREVVMVHDAAWEGSGCGYHTVFRDGDIVRMYYIAYDLTNEDGTRMASRPIHACYAESPDGVHWRKPELGLVEFEGSTLNNIIWKAPGLDNISVFKDANPACRTDEAYKAVSSGPGGLFALRSADALQWSRLADEPIITKGAFDTQNIAFWDPLREHYWCYIRDFHDGVRDIRVSTSTDFRSWSEPELLKYVDSPDEQLYTNQVLPYYRAPHLFVGFPTRYTELPESPVLAMLPDWEHRQRRMKFRPRYGTAVTDGLFMTSRDGRTFNRWGEAFVRPGIERRHNWLYGDGYQNWGLLETDSEELDAPPELSLYLIEDNWKRATRLRRYSMRIDGFVSVQAPLAGGEMVTRPLVFDGARLVLNVSTSGAGTVRVEIQDEHGHPLPGYALSDCHDIFGDSLEKTVSWQHGPDVSKLAGQPVRLRFVLRDADLYALRFSE